VLEKWSKWSLYLNFRGGEFDCGSRLKLRKVSPVPVSRDSDVAVLMWRILPRSSQLSPLPLHLNLQNCFYDSHSMASKKRPRPHVLSSTVATLH
jgi:hypothetical protein